ncbi:MAG TPA: nucleotidyltransferase family protein [Bacillota bacterium]|nr:nucleotidyltransferase family protein [Bacillota bacterium]HOL09952.1 nucleotidyltransferase family protein [Bacillota bacterium]HPO97950.1 nucleotidyltransferase family protein [Bacillota bacterium]
MEAVILAGATNSGPLRSMSNAYYEAEIEIAGRPMITYVIEALQGVSGIEQIIVVGDRSILPLEILEDETIKVVNPGQSLIDSLMNGLAVLRSQAPVLVVTSDIPLISVEALEDFIFRCQQKEGDLYYSFVPKEINDSKYPGVERTYVKLKDGIFTGGNIVLLSPKIIKDHLEKLKKAAALRKKPFQLCSLLGWKYIYKLFIGQLNIAEIEQRVSKIFNFKAVGIVSPYPEVGIDIDKPSDLILARAKLSGLSNDLQKQTS